MPTKTHNRVTKRRARLIESIQAGGYLNISIHGACAEDCLRVILEASADALLYDNEPVSLSQRNRALDLIVDAAKLWRNC